MDDGKIECKVCGERFTFITSSHLKKHNMTNSEYKEKYPDALISGKAFSAKQKYKNKKLFDNKTVETNDEHKEKNVIEDFPLPDDNDELENIQLSFDRNEYINDDIKEYEMLSKMKDYNLDDLEEAKLKSETERKFSDINLSHKKEVAKFLNNIYPDIINDYFVEIKDNLDFLLHRFVTDFASPRKRVIFFFPDVYWHNEETPSISNKYKTLKEHGWKVIEVKGIDVINNMKNKN